MKEDYSQRDVYADVDKAETEAYRIKPITDRMSDIREKTINKIESMKREQGVLLAGSFVRAYSKMPTTDLIKLEMILIANASRA